MRQLEAQIQAINDLIRSNIGEATSDISGLTEAIITEDGQKRIELGKEFAISLNSDHDLTGYHFIVGEVDFSNFQQRGKRKVYFPKAEMSAVFICKDREFENKVLSAIGQMPHCTILKTGSDKFEIWGEEGNENPNFDYHVFKISYNLNYKTDCIDC